MLKLEADQIFDGDKLLSPNTVVIVEDNQIIDIISKENAGENVRKIKGLLCPAFINTHCHLELSHMRNCIPKNIGMIPFLKQVIEKRNLFSYDNILSAIQQADQEMYNNGIAAVGDIANTPYTISIKQTSRIYYHTFIELLGIIPEQAQRKHQEGIALANKYNEEGLLASLTPHAPYSVSRQLFQEIGATPHNEIVSMHYHESQDELDWIENYIGAFKQFYDYLKIPIAKQHIVARNEWKYFFSKQKRIIAVHNTFASEQDIYTLDKWFAEHDTDLFLCICPNANLYIQNILPQIFLLEKFNDKICMGTDSLASNASLDILSELKTIQIRHPDIDLYHLLHWATSNGAKALNVDNYLGSISKGKSAQLITLDGIIDNSLQYATVNRV